MVPTADWRPSVNPWIVAVSVMAATFMEVLDTSVANVALPHIAGNLSASADEATWVLTSYLVSNAIVLPATGWLSRVFGRKRFLIICIAIFTLASALCGAASSLGLLILARVMQGAGGGALQPISQAVLLESFPPAKRGIAMGVFGMGVVVAPIVGPTLGGWITDDYSWRWIFDINVPMGILAAMMVQTFVEDPPYLKRAIGKGIDYVGFGLLTAWLATLQIILDKGQEVDWFAAAWIRALAVIAVAAFVAFVLREMQTAEPIVNLRVLANRNFAVGTLLIAILGIVLYGLVALLPLFLQTLMGYPALQSGLAVSPRGVGALLAMFIVGRLVGLLDTRILLTVGFGLLAVSGVLFGRINLDIGMASVVWPNILSGVAIGFVFVPLATVAMGTLRPEQIGNASGIFNLMRNLGGSVGISLVTTWVARQAQVHQAMLVQHLTAYDPAMQQWLGTAQPALANHTGAVTGAQQAWAVLYNTLVAQATLAAYVDTFRMLALLCLACLPVVLLLGKARSRGPVAVH
jgi:DHA2 family multidrug resistance protein